MWGYKGNKGEPLTNRWKMTFQEWWDENKGDRECKTGVFSKPLQKWQAETIWECSRRNMSSTARRGPIDFCTAYELLNGL